MTLTGPSKYLIKTFPTQKKGRTKQGDKALKYIPALPNILARLLDDLPFRLIRPWFRVNSGIFRVFFGSDPNNTRKIPDPAPKPPEAKTKQRPYCDLAEGRSNAKSSNSFRACFYLDGRLKYTHIYIFIFYLQIWMIAINVYDLITLSFDRCQ